MERGKTEHADTNDASISANPMASQVYILNPSRSRLRVVSNFGDSDRGVGENTHTRTRNFEGDAELPSFLAPSSRRVRNFARAPRSLSPQLETTRSLERQKCEASTVTAVSILPP